MKRLARTLVIVTLLVGGAIMGWLAPTVQGQGTDQARVTQIDSSSFPKVTAYVSVIGPNGEPVGVDGSRIVLYENGNRIKLESVRAIGNGSGQSEPLATLLVIDISGSMNENGKLEAAKNAARAYVEQMRPGDQVGVLAFNDRVQYVQALTGDKGALNAAIGKLASQDNTAMYDALIQGVNILTPVAGRKAIIAMTDGMDNRSSTNADKVISGIGPAGLTISTIGFGDAALGTTQYAGLDEQRLRALADRAGGLYAAASDAASLRKVYEHYARILQNEYALTFTSLSSLRDGINRSLTISLMAPNGAPIGTQGKYNPGGVVPESSKIPTAAPIFLIGMAGLIALLILPGTAAWSSGRLLSQNRATRVRLTDPSKSQGGGINGITARLRSLFSGTGKRKKSSRVKLSEPAQAPPRVRMR